MAVAGLVTAMYATRDGIGVSRDSAVYLGTAASIEAGDGLRVPFRAYPLQPAADPLMTSERLENFPPLYPVVLAGLSRISGLDPSTVARGLNAAALAGLLLLVGGLLYRFSGGRLLVPAIAVVLTLASIDVLVAASMVWTELLFTVLVVAALAVIALHIERPTWVRLGGAAALVALAFLTRFAGAALVAAAVASVLLLARRPLRQRLRDAAVLAVVGSLPVVAWLGASAVSSDRVGNREAVFHPAGAQALVDGSETAVSWLLPSRDPAQGSASVASTVIDGVAGLPRVVRALLVLLAVGVFVGLARRSPSPPSVAGGPLRYLPGVCLMFLLAYLAFLVIGISFLDAALARLDQRILLPAHVVALLAAAILVLRRVDLQRHRVVALAASLPIVLLVVLTDLVAVVDGKQFAGVYAADRWRESPIMDAARALPPDRLIVTNQPNAVWAVTGRSTASVPERESLVTGRVNPNLDTELAQLGRAMRARDAVLVYIRDGGDSDFAATEETLRARLPLRAVLSEQDGTVYEVDCSAATAAEPSELC